MTIKKLITAIVVLLSAGTVMAQQMPPVPTDPNVRIGHLDNGLTYYIRHNAYPENVASYYIAQRVGSINENEDQRGLAHLLEHLAFNGTDHFKDNDLQEYLQSIGVAYGRNLNAYTATDQTVYYFTDVPTKRATAVDSCMLILKDWSNGITLTQKAIDDERDVVHNEYRMRITGYQKIMERDLPLIYPGSKYGQRFPIGLMSVIDGCNPETLRAYYRKWYRPDNQAIIVVGDIDVDKIEAKIKELFADIKVPADAAKVVPEEVPDNNTAIYVVDKDKELPADIALICMKSDVMPIEARSTMEYYVKAYTYSAITSMLNQRLDEKAKEPDCPFLQAYVSDGNFLYASTKDALQMQVVAKQGQMKEAYAAGLTELKRAHDYGFCATEYLRTKDEILSQMEKAYTNRDKMKNEQFTGQYVSNFTNNDPIPSVEQEYQIYQQVSQIPVEIINQIAQKMISQSDTNFVSLVMMQEKDSVSYPTTQELTDIVAKVRSTKLEPYVDNVKQEPLISQAPKAGKITKTTEVKQLGCKKLKLSNGVTVYIKKTDFKDDEIVLYAHANGGAQSLAESDVALAKFIGNVASAGGLGNFSQTELQKALAGKQAGCGIDIDNNKRALSGRSTPKDIETFFQLIYLNMTSLAKDEKSQKNLINSYSTILKNQSNLPNMVFHDSIASTFYPGNKYFRMPTSEEVESVDIDKATTTAKSFFSNAKDFSFYFIGNFDEATILPLIETYIASLPVNNNPEIKQVPKIYAKGEVKNEFTKQMENPQSQALETWTSEPQPYTLANNVSCRIACRLLDMNYNRSIREKLSAAYYAGASNGIHINPDGKTIYSIEGSAQLNPDKTKEAIPYFFSGMKEVSTTPDEADLQKVKEILLKQADVDAKTNGYWTGVLSTYHLMGIDTHTDYKKTISDTTAKNITDFLQNIILKPGNHIEVIMNATK